MDTEIVTEMPMPSTAVETPTRFQMEKVPLENWARCPESDEFRTYATAVSKWTLDDAEGDSLPEGVDIEEAKLRAVLGATYEEYADVDKEMEFYEKCILHIGDLYTVAVGYADDGSPFRECIFRLAHAMCEIDTETGVNGVPRITAETSPEERVRIGDLLEADRRKFSNILAANLAQLQKYPDAATMFTEFSRVIFRMNGYQPPPRTIQDAHKIPLDIKGEIDYFDEVLQNLADFVINESSSGADADFEAPPVIKMAGDMDAEFECAQCGAVYTASLVRPILPTCEKCTLEGTEKSDC